MRTRRKVKFHLVFPVEEALKTSHLANYFHYSPSLLSLTAVKVKAVHCAGGLTSVSLIFITETALLPIFFLSVWRVCDYM